MAVRTTSTAVGKLIEIYDEDVDFDPFIETANSVVTDVCTDSGYSAAKLELIERWLAAHFYAVRELPAHSESVRGVSESKMYYVGMDLRSTMYGQQAMLIDTAGNLAALNKQMTTGGKTPVVMAWLGTEDDETVEV